jgi:PAS domain S-box-containing protein
MNPFFRFVRTYRYLTGLALGGLPVGYLLFLLLANYSAQLELRRAFESRFLQEEKNLANSMGEFFTYLTRELTDFSETREVSVYFENKALGMSMEYGLRFSLQGIEESLRRLAEEKSIGKTPPFSRIIFLDNRGEKLGDTAQPPGNRETAKWKAPIASPPGRPFLELEGRNPVSDLILWVPCRFKGQVVGLVGAWISMKTLQEQFHLNSKDLPHRSLRPAFPEHTSRDSGPAAVSSSPENGASALRRVTGEGEETLETQNGVPGIPVMLVTSVPADRVYGRTNPRGLLIAMGVLGISMLGGLAYFLRINTRNLVLHARLEESAKRQTEIENQNRILAEEIANRKRVAEILENREDQYRTLIENIPDLVYAVDKAGFISHVSKAAGLYGYAEGEIIGKSFLEIICPEDRAQLLFSFEEALRNRREYTSGLRFRILTKEGTYRWVEVNSRTRFDLNGAMISDEGILRDITERRQAEMELEQYRSKLEEMVEDRTAQLKQTQKALVVKATEAGRAQMAAVVLHNIGNAITPAMVFVETLGTGDEKKIYSFLQRCYEELKAQAEDLTRFVTVDIRGRQVFAYLGSLILEMTRQQEHRQEVLHKIDTALSYVAEILTLEQSYGPRALQMQETVDLNRLVTDALRMQAGSLHNRNIEVLPELSREPLFLKIDKNRLMQTLVNLIRNSCDAVDQLADAARHHILRVRTFAGKGRKVFEIEDTGIGLEGNPEVYFEFGKSLKGSSGFGLTYCRDFVEQNGGTIQLTSPGRGLGATVRIELPTATPASPGEKNVF